MVRDDSGWLSNGLAEDMETGGGERRKKRIRKAVATQELQHG